LSRVYTSFLNLCAGTVLISTHYSDQIGTESDAKLWKHEVLAHSFNSIPLSNLHCDKSILNFLGILLNSLRTLRTGTGEMSRSCWIRSTWLKNTWGSLRYPYLHNQVVNFTIQA